MKPALVILAAGIGSRYGGLKQIDTFGPNGETLIDYSIYDAINAGFKKIIFIIRPELLKVFKTQYDHKFDSHIQVHYTFQEIKQLFGASVSTVKREKPWGTGHAVLSAHKVIKEPFIVINADDYYGPDAYRTVVRFFETDQDEKSFCLVSYKLGQTLSDSGSVARAVCITDGDDYLLSITDLNIMKNDNRIIYSSQNGREKVIDPEMPVSMNFWGLKPAIFPYLKNAFYEFIETSVTNSKAEFLLPEIIGNMIKAEQASVKVFSSKTLWFGVTYPQDKAKVKAKIKNLIKEDLYPSPLTKRLRT